MSGKPLRRSRSACGRQSNNSSEKPQVFCHSSWKSTAVNQSTETSSLHEISIIDSMTRFLEANGAAEVDQKVLRNMAEMLSKRFNDSSPGTVQDVTMDNSYAVGYRSPCVSLQQYQGSTSPAGQGRSVREFEEQMAALRKENFNLKLRLYFIEESIPGYQQNNAADGQETLMKQLIDTKVEMQILRKEMEEKQEILKEAALALDQMEKIQKESELKSQRIIDELTHKLHCVDMEREMEKSHTDNNEFMNNLLGRSDISENINAIQRIRELEGIVKQSEGKLIDFQDQISKLDDLLAKRDETIKEYEEKVKELAFQNSELLETLENREKEAASAERTFRGLRKSNADLKEENSHLIEALRTTQENFRKELSNMKSCERQMREQQDTLSKMQSTISIKTANTARLLERIQEYEKMVTKMNFERNVAKRENRFFRAIIGKLQRSNSKNEYFTIEKEEIYQQIGAEYNEKPLDGMPSGDNTFDSYYREMKARGDFHGEYKLKQKLCVNFCNAAKFSTSCSTVDGCEQNFIQDDEDDYYCNTDRNYEPEIPIRYTFSDGNMFNNTGGGSGGCYEEGGGVRGCDNCCVAERDDICCGGYNMSKTNSCSSLQANFSSSSIIAGRELSDEILMKSKVLREELQEIKRKLADKMCMLQETEEELANLKQAHEQSRKLVQKSQSTAKEHTIGSATGGCIECTGLCRSFSDTEMLNSAQKQSMENKIAEQETLIRSLKAEVKKKTANLQNLVNKELWEKNREIERLTQLINKNQIEGEAGFMMTSPTSPTRKSSGELQQSFSDAEYQKALERNKLLQKKVDILIQRLNSNNNNETLIMQLRSEVNEAHNNAENAERFRRNCMSICALLSQRLDELAGFLNSLLKQKDVLGILAADRRNAMRAAVDRSLGLSKSLNMTLSTTATSICEQSFLQLSNLSDMLGSSQLLLEDQTFNSHEDLYAHEQSIETLKAENKALKKELDKRRSTTADAAAKKERRSLPIFVAENQSESEAWSEPDRKVSLARIGLDEHSTSMAKSVTSAVTVAGASPAAAKGLETDSDSDVLNQSRTNKTSARTMERIALLEQMISQRDDRILEIQCQLVEADNRLKKENLKVIDMTQELAQVLQRNEELQADLVAIGTVPHEQSVTGRHEQSLLRHQIEEKTHSLQKIQEERDRLALETRFAEMKITAIQKDMEEIKAQHDNALQMAHSHEQEKLAHLRTELNTMMEQRLAEQQRLHAETLERDWIARHLYEEGQKRLKELQRQLNEAHSTIEYLNENEQQTKQMLIDNELAMRAVKKQLDESTLQASKAVLERTKALNEKLNLEKRIQELIAQLQAHDAERNALQQKITELEGVKLALQEQIVSSQTSKLNNSSDVSQSGYTSEEVPAAPINGNNKSSHEATKEAVSLAQADSATAQRRNNPSPDLGIESDAGRVSSVELSNAQHANLKTVELAACDEATTNRSIREESVDTSAMKVEAKPTNLLTYTTHSPHDCAKVDQENADLRRKLVRTKRAFEDTYEKLRVANQKKAQVEKDIKNQILKTHNLLRNVRSNMENGM